MINILKTLLLDFLEMNLETGVRRQVNVEPVHGKATVCIGVRRCGKSTYLFQIMQALLDKGVPRENILYLNFFDDRLHNLQHKGLEITLEAYYSLYPEKKNQEKLYCFFDEIQMISNWEPFIDRLLRTENCEIYITGSSAQMLSKEIATQMRGRALSWELFPFSFKEYLEAKDIKFSGSLSTKNDFLSKMRLKIIGYRVDSPKLHGLNVNLRLRFIKNIFRLFYFATWLNDIIYHIQQL